jgi:transposase-like protein
MGLWAAINMDTNEILAVYAIKFLRKVLDSCEDKPVIVADKGPCYKWALERLGITCFQETFNLSSGVTISNYL